MNEPNTADRAIEFWRYSTVILAEAWRKTVRLDIGTDAVLHFVQDALRPLGQAKEDRPEQAAEQFRFAQLVARALHAYEERLKVDLQAVMDAADQDEQAIEDAHREHMAGLEHDPECDSVAAAEERPQEPTAVSDLEVAP